MSLHESSPHPYHRQLTSNKSTSNFHATSTSLRSFAEGGKNEDTSSNDKRNPLQFMQRVLEYAETPQYLKQSLHPNHADLQVSPDYEGDTLLAIILYIPN